MQKLLLKIALRIAAALAVMAARKLIRRFFALLAVTALFLAGIFGVTSAATPASADPCTGVWSIGIGGFTLTGAGVTGQDSTYLNVNQRVGYNSANVYEGIGRLNEQVVRHRADCASDHIQIIAHSGGALAAHRWITDAQSFPNLSAVLIADPARAAGPGGPGFSAAELGWLGGRYAGTDANFGTIPVLQVCHPNDHICNSHSDWWGYATGAHLAYSFNAWDYPINARGTNFS